MLCKRPKGKSLCREWAGMGILGLPGLGGQGGDVRVQRVNMEKAAPVSEHIDDTVENQKGDSDGWQHDPINILFISAIFLILQKKVRL